MKYIIDTEDMSKAAARLRTSILDYGPQYDNEPTQEAVEIGLHLWLDGVMAHVLADTNEYLFGGTTHFPNNDRLFDQVIRLFAAGEDDSTRLTIGDEQAIELWGRLRGYSGRSYVSAGKWYLATPTQDYYLRTRGDFAALRATLAPVTV